MLHNVASRGYDVLSPVVGFDAESAARDPWDVATQFFGDPPSMVERQPIKPVPQGRSFASNAAFTPLHTDSQRFGGVSPHAQLMFCAKAAREGGTTLLLDTHALLATIQQEDIAFLRALFSESRTIPFVFGDVVGPTVSWRQESLVFTHSPKRVEDEIGRKLQGFLSRAPIIEVPVRDGEILIVDNHRMLHGRTAFTDESRRFTRLLVWRHSSFTRHVHFDTLARAEADRARASCRDARVLRARGLSTWPSEATEWRRRIVLEMLRGVPPGVLAQRHGIPEPMLYVWRDAAIAAMDQVLGE
jgi:hypothetical protein